MSDVSTHHPLFDESLPDWTQMRDTYEGERCVKIAGRTYLPLTSGMIADGATSSNESTGAQNYDSYRKRARFPDELSEAVESLLGVMHHKPATIELPDSMEFLRDDASARGESLQMMLRRVNQEQLTLGRVGLLADVIDSGDRKDDPYLSVYDGEKIINWDEGRNDGIEVENLNLVVLNETENERTDGFQWDEVEKYRVLTLGELTIDEGFDEDDEPVVNLPEGEGEYQMGVFRQDDLEFSPEEMETLQIKGRSLNKIPFVFINTKDIVAEPDKPPLIGLSNLTLTIYRGEADYRLALFMQGQDTLVIIGTTEDEGETRTGAGATIRIKNSEFGKAMYIGVESEGLTEMRLALENDYNRAGEKGAQLLDSVSGSQQSGDALRIRVAAKTATLNQIALTGAFGMQTILRIVAEWMGANPEEVIVTPNLDFADDRMSGKELVDLMAAKTVGAPLSNETIHRNMQDQGMTEMSLKEELSSIEEEAPLGGEGSSHDDGPEPDDDPEDE